MIDEVHESLKRLLNGTQKLGAQLDLEPCLPQTRHMRLSGAAIQSNGQLHLLADGGDRLEVVIDVARGDYIYKTESDYYFSANNTEGRIVRVCGH